MPLPTKYLIQQSVHMIFFSSRRYHNIVRTCCAIANLQPAHDSFLANDNAFYFFDTH